jgi:site-specific DNA recombinase
MKAIILARVSTEDQMQEGYSIPAQLQRAREYCQKKGLIVQSEHPFDESSTKDQRKKFELVVDEIRKAKEVVALVVETVDRLQRSFKESVMLDELRKQGKLEIHFLRENLVIHKDSNSSEIQRWDLAVFVAKSYVLQLSDNVKRSFDIKRRSGEITSNPPIGYQGVYDTTGKRIDVIPNPDTAHYIQKMFELYATGQHSTLTLMKEMVKLGLRSKLGKKLSLSMIDKILNDTFYYGVAYSRTKKIYWDHKYKPIITKELFDRGQKIRQSWNKKPFKYASKPYIFRGLVRCKKCGCSMSPETAKGKFVYYSCTNARKDLCDTKVYVPEKAFLEPIYGVLRAFQGIPQERIDKVVEGLKQSTEAKTLYNRNSIEALDKEYALVQVKIDKIMDLLIDSSITKVDYDKKLKELKEKQYDLNIQKEEHTKADENYYITASTVFNLAKNALKLFESSEIAEKRSILNYLLQNCVANGKKLEFSLRSPFNEILNTSQIISKLRG